jgi:NADH:ubiquinone reductase (H+-translocating)
MTVLLHRGPATRHRVVIIGSGFGGLFAARELSRAPAEVTLISKTPAHVFQPLLYQVATGILSEGEVAPPTRSVLHRQKNTRVILGTVTGIEVRDRRVTSVTEGMVTETTYDSLVVAAGAETNYFGNPMFARSALGMKTLEDAMQIRSRVFRAFEIAELRNDPADRARWLTFVVVGAGPTGVELAGQIAELSRRTLRTDFRSIDPSECRVVLVEAGSVVLPTFSAPVSRAAAAHLDQIGVGVHLGATVRSIDDDAVGISVSRPGGEPAGARIESKTVLWTAGVTASPLARLLSQQTGSPLTRGGRIVVEPDLTLAGHPEIFVVGDMAALDDLPGVAQVAIQEGRYAAGTIRGRIDGRSRRERFRYIDKGMLATISRFFAVADIGPVRLSGFLAWVLWLTVHLVYLVGFKNRVTTLFHWVVSFLGRQRSERTAIMTGDASPANLPTIRPDTSARSMN